MQKLNGKYDIKLEDLPEDLAELVETIGFEATLKTVWRKWCEGC